MATLGFIGSGSIGTKIARLAVDAGIDVVLSNSRDPQSLSETVAGLGERARAATPEEAARAGDWVVVSIPLAAYRDLPAAALAGRTVLDTINYIPMRDGRVDALDTGATTAAELVQAHLAGAHLVTAFGNICDFHLLPLARPAGATDRTALPIAGDDPRAKEEAADLIGRLGFDTVDAGPLSESWRFEPETLPFATPYAADPDALWAAYAAYARLAEDPDNGNPPQWPPADPGTPLPASRLRTLLAQASRKLTADRVFT
ncbi:NAD(P)-binding domain-containing protein [Streptomyces roseirectus]|uniref:NAD(P)-binding domain-containing protein n=1 Tax=Streptomyces roseirectus TaxID=2768066 RepID=A0A7H0I5W7_9ACTN|nr:NAD(P)-binding domain-containing protein [Streptomyces roseirectus]QNP68183.1 NAD(P)-binding domain-containing protein [Streptomyces roseirectus]